MIITHQGAVEGDERFSRYSHRLLNALKPLATIREAIVTLEQRDDRYHLEVSIHASTRAITVRHTAPNALAAMDICYYDLRKRLVKRRALQQSKRQTLVQRVAGRLKKS